MASPRHFPKSEATQNGPLFLLSNIGLLIFTTDLDLSPNVKAQRRRGADSAEGKDDLPGVLCSAWFGSVVFVFSINCWKHSTHSQFPEPSV
jgi:hypothetical protein